MTPTFKKKMKKKHTTSPALPFVFAVCLCDLAVAEMKALKLIFELFENTYGSHMMNLFPFLNMAVSAHNSTSCLTSVVLLHLFTQ